MEVQAAQLGQRDGLGGALPARTGGQEQQLVRDALADGILRPAPTTRTNFRIDENGYVNAPTEPGLGYPIDHDALDKMMIRVDR